MRLIGGNHAWRVWLEKDRPSQPILLGFAKLRLPMSVDELGGQGDGLVAAVDELAQPQDGGET